MNKRLKVRAKYELTNKRKSSVLIAKSEEDVITILKSSGYIEPFEIEDATYEPPTEAQLNYAKILNIKVPDGASKDDLIALISVQKEGDSEPNSELIEYATEQGLLFSKYIGKKALYNIIFHNASIEDKVAFFIFSIYRWLSDDRHANLNKHQYKDLFYRFAKQYIEDDKFLKSLNKYRGSELRYFGLLKFTDGGETNGGSVNTIAYKTCAEFLHKHLGVQKTKTITLTSNNTQPDKGKSENTARMRSGCLGIAISILFVALAIASILK